MYRTPIAQNPVTRTQALPRAIPSFPHRRHGSDAASGRTNRPRYIACRKAAPMNSAAAGCTSVYMICRVICRYIWVGP